MAKKTCHECGASMVEYRHSLSSILVQVLEKLHQYGGAANLKELGLDRNEWDNFQKLRYWDLVDKLHMSGKRVQGSWFITQRGKEFLLGNLKVNLVAITYRGKTVRFEGKEVIFSQILDGSYKQRREYEEDSIPVGA